jgi:hypothetical protein
VKARYASTSEGRVSALWTRADVYHCHDLDTLLPGTIASRLRRKPLVYDAHELFTDTHFLVGREKERRIWAFLERKLIRSAKRVITVSEPIAVELARRHGIEKPLVLRNAPAYREPCRAGLPDAPEEPVFLVRLPQKAGLRRLSARCATCGGRLVLSVTAKCGELKTSSASSPESQERSARPS